MWEDFKDLCKFSFELKDSKAHENTLTLKLEADHF